MVVSILGSERQNPFTDGGRELFDCAAQGRIDAFFLSGVQIDARANVNLLGLGAPPRLQKRFLGNFGAPYLASLVPHLILFRTDHGPRSLVEEVDFISAPGADGRWLVTDKALLRRRAGRLQLESVHAGETLASVQSATGFPLDAADTAPTTPTPDEATIALIRGPISVSVGEIYPAFETLMRE